SMAKLTVGRLQREVADSCLQYYGGMGFMNETEITRFFRDGRLTSIGGGADEGMFAVISQLIGNFPGQNPPGAHPLGGSLMPHTLPPCNTLLLQQRGSRLDVTLHRPDAKNALNAEMVQDLLRVVEFLENARDIGTVVLRGAAGTFCAGGDIKGFMAQF